VSDQVSHSYKTADKIIVHHSLPSCFPLTYFSLRERNHFEDPGVDGRTLVDIRENAWAGVVPEDRAIGLL
jgi:hypothetical protein